MEEARFIVSGGSATSPGRRFARVDTDFPVTVVLPAGEPALTGKAVNLSAGGMRVIAASDVPTGEAVVLRFALPGEECERSVGGRIVRSLHDAISKEFVYGVAFTQFERNDREALEQFVARAREAAP